jgi:ADP-heptose:LPS heptosyltransferase
MTRPVVIISGSVREALFAQPLVAMLEGASIFAPSESLGVLRLDTVGHGFAIGADAGWLRPWGRLRRLPVTQVVVPPPVSTMSAMIAYLSGIQRRVALAGFGDWCATDRTPVSPGLHPVDAMARLAAHVLRNDQEPRAPRLEPGEAALERLDRRLLAAGVRAADRVLVAIPGRGNWIRRGSGRLWPPERFAVVANQIHPDLLVIVRGAGDERQVRDLRAGVAFPSIIADLRAMAPDEFAALARRSMVVIGHDGDALHAAAAGGGRALGLVGPGDIEPYGGEAAAVRVDALEVLPARAVVEAARRHLGVPLHA